MFFNEEVSCILFILLNFSLPILNSFVKPIIIPDLCYLANLDSVCCRLFSLPALVRHLDSVSNFSSPVFEQGSTAVRPVASQENCRF